MAAPSYILHGEYNSASIDGDAESPGSAYTYMSQFIFPHNGTLLSWRVIHVDPSAGFSTVNINYYLYKNQDGSDTVNHHYIDTISLAAQSFTTTTKDSGNQSLGISISEGDYIVVTYKTSSTFASLNAKVTFMFQPNL